MPEPPASSGLAWPLAIGFLIILANGFFVAVEFALVTSRRSKLEETAAKGSRAAKVVLKMLEDPDRAIAASQLGITAASILVGVVAEEPLSEIITPLLGESLGRFVSPAAAAGIAAFVVLLILSFFHMVVGEQTPKLIAIRSPERAAEVLALPMRTFTRLTAPFVWVVDGATALMLRLLGIRSSANPHGTVASLEELKSLVRQSGQAGLLEAEEQAMVYRVFEFGETVVREVMVPRTNIVGIDCSQTVDELLAIVRTHPHARFPAFIEDLDHIAGVVSMRDLFPFLLDHPEARGWTVGDLPIIEEPLRVPESRLVSDLFAEMRSSAVRFAVVIDEFGGTAGLATMDEMVEEIVGRINVEWSTPPEMQRLAEHSFAISAQLSVDEVNERLGLHLPEADEYETIAGLILQILRHIPVPGEELSVSGYRLRVLEVEGPKITRIAIEE
ncbi:MAG: hemolysin family protein [Caldilineales bacterium]|nr:hemolysin family protein [Caldilineales bacterium]MCW5857066.1 HlyC/CorC family transporter [Caldilineales bacterium]